MPVNLEIGDYVTWITIMNVGTTYVDEILVVDEQDAMDSEMLEDAEKEPDEGGSDDSGSGNNGSGNQSSGNTGNQATNAPTGDNANFTLPLMGILMSMIVMAGAIATSKKKKNI